MRIRFLSLVLFFSCISSDFLHAQVKAPKLGKGIQISAQDSSFYMKMGFRMHTLYQSDWNLKNDELFSLEDHHSKFVSRRVRMALSGWALNPKLTYKIQLAFTNLGNGKGADQEHNFGANIVYDAYLEYNFYKNMSIRFGQGKLPGHQEFITSSSYLHFADRSRLNSRFSLDRDIGIVVNNFQSFGDQFILKESFAISTGEGRNITTDNIGGNAYTFRIEALPFGNFKSKSNYFDGGVIMEEKPKLSLGLVYDKNERAGRERGQGGAFISIENDSPVLKNLTTFFADLMFSHQRFTILAEYVSRNTDDGLAQVYSVFSQKQIGTYYIGRATNLSIAYLLNNHWEIAGRWTSVHPDEGVANDETRYTLGGSKFFAGHKFKIVSDVTYRSVDGLSEDDLIYRLQLQVDF